MQHWEYLILDSEYGHLRKVNGKRYWGRGIRILDFLNQKGLEGWELVTDLEGVGTKRTYTLKRPLSQEKQSDD